MRVSVTECASGAERRTDVKQKKNGFKPDGEMLVRMVRANRIRCCFDLAIELGTPYTSVFDEKVKKAAPGIEHLMRRYDAVSSGQWARKEGMLDMIKEFGVKAVAETAEWGRRGGAFCLKRGFLDLPDLSVKAREKLWKEFEKSATPDGNAAFVKLWKGGRRSSVPADAEELKAPTGERLDKLNAGEVEGEAMASCVLGRTGEEYGSRPVYIARRVKGMFGDAGELEYTYRCTVVNGIVNQFPISRVPGRFWAVMDAACELKTGFSEERLAGRAMERMRELGTDCSEEECLSAWVIIRNHQFKRRKDGLCMGYLVEGGEGVFRMRARNADETAGYFAAVKRRAANGVELKDGVEPPVQPTEDQPVSVVVEQMR